MHDRTALAEAEVEYENHTSPTVWVRYRLQSDPRTIDPALADAVFTAISRFHDHLDHDSMDAPGFDGGRISSQRRVRGARNPGRDLHRGREAGKGCGPKNRRS